MLHLSFFVLYSQVRPLHTLVVSLAEEDTANFDFDGVYYDIDIVGEGFGESADVCLRLFPTYDTNKTKCQLCKRPGGPIIPLLWYGLI